MAKRKSIKEYAALGNISAELIFKNLPYVLFLSFLAMIYIANAHFSEKKVREIQNLQTELKQLRWQYMSLKSELMFDSKRSEVVKSVKPLGLKVNKKKPNKILIKKE